MLPPDPTRQTLRRGFSPAAADCGLQGTATSPPSTTSLCIQKLMAEREGFEPSRQVLARLLAFQASALDQLSHLSAFTIPGGESGIRTHGTAHHSPLDFESSALDQLSHLSAHLLFVYSFGLAQKAPYTIIVVKISFSKTNLPFLPYPSPEPLYPGCPFSRRSL